MVADVAAQPIRNTTTAEMLYPHTPNINAHETVT